jgi:hypothetical protein
MSQPPGFQPPAGRGSGGGPSLTKWYHAPSTSTCTYLLRRISLLISNSHRAVPMPKGTMADLNGNVRRSRYPSSRSPRCSSRAAVSRILAGVVGPPLPFQLDQPILPAGVPQSVSRSGWLAGLAGWVRGWLAWLAGRAASGWNLRWCSGQPILHACCSWWREQQQQQQQPRQQPRHRRNPYFRAGSSQVALPS